MSRSVEALILKDSDRTALNDIASGRVAAGEDVVKRARAILKMCEGQQLKAIALELDMRPNTITDIRKRYLKYGISSITDQARTGRPVKIPQQEAQYSLEKIIQDSFSSKTPIPSVKDISKQLNVPEATVRDILKSKGIISERKRIWDFRTSNGLIARYIDIVGIYLSPMQQLIIVQTFPDSTENVIPDHKGNGIVTIHNHSLACRIQENTDSDGGIELAKSLEAFCFSEDKTIAKKSNGALDYVQSVVTSLTNEQGTEYHIFAYGDPIITTGRMFIKGTYLHQAESVTEWVAQVESIIDVLYLNGDDYDVSTRICNGIKNYLRHADKAIDIFEWKKLSSMTDQRESELPVVEKAKDKQDVTPGTMLVVAKIMGDDGKWIETTVSGQCPTQADFDISSTEAYLQSFHQVEQDIIVITQEAARSMNEKYLNEIWKKNSAAK